MTRHLPRRLACSTAPRGAQGGGRPEAHGLALQLQTTQAALSCASTGAPREQGALGPGTPRNQGMKPVDTAHPCSPGPGLEGWLSSSWAVMLFKSIS